jgi:hypothetical protein
MQNGLQESDSLGLRFDGHDDALNHVEKLVERGQNFLAVDELDFVKRYKEGSLVINVEMVAHRELGKYQLVFVAIPSGWVEKVNPHCGSVKTNIGIGDHHGPKDAVLISVAQFVQCPKERVPTLVWLCTAYDVPNLLREFSASTFDGFLEVRSSSADGEKSGISRQRTESMDGTDGLVQSVSEADRRTDRMTPQGHWHRFTQFELDHLPQAITAFLDDAGASIVVAHESNDLSVKFGKVVLSPSNGEFWGIKRIACEGL